MSPINQIKKKNINVKKTGDKRIRLFTLGLDQGSGIAAIMKDTRNIKHNKIFDIFIPLYIFYEGTL